MNTENKCQCNLHWLLHILKEESWQKQWNTSKKDNHQRFYARRLTEIILPTDIVDVMTTLFLQLQG